jgi:hypothetical protein
MAFPNLHGWLQIGGVSLVIGWLTVAIHGHVASGALVTVGLSPGRIGLRTLTTAVVVAVVILGLLDVLGSPAFLPPSKPATPTRPHAVSQVSSQAVVEAFFSAINNHNWPKVWHLGGEHLGRAMYRTYNGMISGFRCTTRDVFYSSPTTRGNVVSGSFLAYEDNGTKKTVQRFAFSYVVRHGVIVSGHAYLLSGRLPAGC